MQTDEQKLNIVGAAAQLLLENGSETYRVEETARRMAKGFGIGEINIAAFPTSVFLEAGGRAFVRRIAGAVQTAGGSRWSTKSPARWNRAGSARKRPDARWKKCGKPPAFPSGR